LLVHDVEQWLASFVTLEVPKEELAERPETDCLF
jgi:hypothetical protein